MTIKIIKNKNEIKNNNNNNNNDSNIGSDIFPLLIIYKCSSSIPTSN